METQSPKNVSLPADNPLEGLLAQLDDSLGKALEITKFLSKCVVDGKRRQLEQEEDEDERKDRTRATMWPEDVTDTPLVRMLFAQSKYAIDPGEMTAVRRRDLDTDKTIALQFTSSVHRKVDEKTSECVNETFVLHSTPDLKETVAAFDSAVGNFHIIRFVEKKDLEKPVACRKGCAGMCGHECKGPCKPKNSGNAVNFVDTKKGLEELKGFLLKHSKYAIPSTRFQILADKVDRKSRKYVYELRFFQRSYRRDETQSYENAYLRIKFNGDRDERILARFDKAVEGLRFNEFERK